ncbi:MAG: glycosyltransferase family 39 protein [Planctomycetes bacterium]|nr:glycosyltransferase family 39 protein [Planctomycetota bacterium]
MSAPPDAREGAWSERAWHGAALAFAAAALLLRLWRIGTQPLWFDEALTAHIAYGPDGLDYVHNTPPLYHWLTRLWSGVFGVGAAGLRSFSAVAGAAFVWSTFHTARFVFGNRAAVAAALLVLASPLHLYYSQEARAYALLLCELMLALWLLWRLVARLDVRTWLLLVLASTAALHTHYLAAIPLAIAFAVLGRSAPAAARWRTARWVAAAGAAAVLLLLPWLLWWSRHTPFAASDMRWLELLWAGLSGPGAIATSFELFLLGGQAERTPLFLKQFSSLPFPAALRIAALVAMGAVAALGLLRRSGPSPQRRAALACATLCLGPLLVLWLVSLVRPVYGPGRYDLIAYPGFVLLLGQAIAAATAAPGRVCRWLAWSAVAALALAVVGKDWRYFTAPAGPDPNRAVAQQLAARVPSGDTVILCGSVGLPVIVHLYDDGYVWAHGRCRSARSGVEFGCRLLPPALAAAPAAVSRYLQALEDGSLVADLAQIVQDVPASTSGIWLVLGQELLGAGLAPAMQQMGRDLLRVLDRAGYELVDADRQLGVAQFRRR